MRRGARLLALAGTAALLLGLWPVDGIEIENGARGRSWRLALPAGGRFSITAQHSMYGAPWTETFTVEGGERIALREVSSPSAAVREYLGITGPGERHAAERALPELVLRVAAGAAQSLRAGDAERSLLDFGAHGDRLVIRAVRRPALARLLERTP